MTIYVERELNVCYSCDYYNTTGNDVCAECGIEYDPQVPDTIPSPTQADIEGEESDIEDEDSDFHLSSAFYRAFIREVKRVENGY